MQEITNEMVSQFLNGHDPMERIISIECDYQEDEVSIIYANAKGEKRIKKDDFKPFVWVKHSAANRMFGGDRSLLKKKMSQYGIEAKRLSITRTDGKEADERIQNGYKFLFKAKRKMPMMIFQKFFAESGVPLREKSKDKSEKDPSSKEYLSVTPVEQYMIESGKRLFKGYESYDELNRFIFDLETQGLNPKRHRIEQIGVHTNKGFDKVISVEGNTKEELDKSELNAIDEFLRLLAELKPDTVVGHNSENFDWDFLIQRASILGQDFGEMSLKYFRRAIVKKDRETVLKLGGEVEYYKPTVMWGHNVLDSLHAARRAQAIDSNMKSSNLKYVTKYLNMKKDNRVYVQGDKITTTWNDKEKHYALNNENGDWYKITNEHPIENGYELVSGRYIVERYLLDDLWETDKIENKLNESNFLVGKMLPTTFTRACTMGTAGIWKLIMLAWSYENELAVPALGVNKKFTGGLSRLLKTGYVSDIVKLDYNSLYPSVILTFNILNRADASNVLNKMLLYVLSQREKYKGLKAAAGDKIDALKADLNNDSLTKEQIAEIQKQIKYWKGEKSGNDKKQLPLKILGNSYFGSAGSEHLFPWGDNVAAEMTTCISRQLLRLMISHFTNIGYTPIVGDSFTQDTPVFIKYDLDDKIDIKPICELPTIFRTDEFGREYDTCEKPFKVLCRSGWMKPSYIYRHKTNKPIYKVSEWKMEVEVTEDHSLFNDKQEKIKPSEINDDTRLEYCRREDFLTPTYNYSWLNETRARRAGKWLIEGTLDRVPIFMFNTKNLDYIKAFLEAVKDLDLSKVSKTCKAGIIFLKSKLENDGK